MTIIESLQVYNYAAALQNKQEGRDNKLSLTIHNSCLTTVIK